MLFSILSATAPIACCEVRQGKPLSAFDQKKLEMLDRQITLMKKLIRIDHLPGGGAGAQEVHGYYRRVDDPDGGISMCSIKGSCYDFDQGVGTWLVDRWSRAQVDALLAFGLMQRSPAYDLEYQPIHLFYSCWRGVTSERDVIKEIVWRRQACVIPSIALEWFPPCLQTIHIDSQTTSQSLETRKLPRRLVSLRIMRCDLSGTVDFQTLPHRLKEVNLTANNMEGTLWLTMLPPFLAQLDVSGNKFSTIALVNMYIPDSLREVNIRQTRKETKIIALDGPEVHQLFSPVLKRK